MIAAIPRRKTRSGQDQGNCGNEQDRISGLRGLSFHRGLLDRIDNRKPTPAGHAGQSETIDSLCRSLPTPRDQSREAGPRWSVRAPLAMRSARQRAAMRSASDWVTHGYAVPFAQQVYGFGLRQRPDIAPLETAVEDSIGETGDAVRGPHQDRNH